MVKSGLDPKIIEENREPRVSHYRLAAHLASALAIYIISLRTGMGILVKPSAITLRPPLLLINSLILTTALSGSLVAGLDAGMIYNSFPKMGLTWIPSDGWFKTLGWKNLFENPSMVQFIHRCLAITTVFSTTCIFFFWRKKLKSDPLISKMMGALAALSWGQASLGVFTLLFTVPISMASAHQAGSLVLIGLATALTAKLPAKKLFPKSQLKDGIVFIKNV